LLGLLPGVEVVWVRQSPHLTRLGMAIRSQESLACVAWFTFAANLLLVVETEDNPRRDGAAYDPAALRYDLRAASEPEDAGPPSRLEVMGIYLARELKKRGLLAPSEADNLQGAWNAVVM
jgi:hypothetical protein